MTAAGPHNASSGGRFGRHLRPRAQGVPHFHGARRAPRRNDAQDRRRSGGRERGARLSRPFALRSSRLGDEETSQRRLAPIRALMRVPRLDIGRRQLSGGPFAGRPSSVSFAPSRRPEPAGSRSFPRRGRVEDGQPRHDDEVDFHPPPRERLRMRVGDRVRRFDGDRRATLRRPISRTTERAKRVKH